MLAADLTIVPEGVRLLEGKELLDKLEDLTKKGVLKKSEKPLDGIDVMNDIFYLGVSKNKWDSKLAYKAAYWCDGLEGQGLYYYPGYSNQYIGLCYLGSDNRIYPANNDRSMITRLIIEVD